MKRKWMIALSVAVVVLGSAAYVVIGFVWLEARASHELLDKLALAKPGVSLSEVSDQLGTKMRECSVRRCSRLGKCEG